MLEPKIRESDIIGAEQSVATQPPRSPWRFLATDRPLLPKELILWAGKGGLAILDQGLIAGSNFLISVLLARWLVPEQYGAYAVAFGISVLLSTVYQALMLEPMSVFGGSSYRDCLRGYLRSLLWIHLIFSLVIVVVFGTSAFLAKQFSGSPILAGALAGVTVASPFILVFGLARRSFYLQLLPLKAAMGALVYSSLSMGGLFFLYHRALLSPFTAFTLMGIAAFGTAVYNLARLRSYLPRAAVAPGMGESWRRHWGYGRWALASCVVNWIPAYIYYPLLSSFASMAQSGQLKALMNFTLPVEQTKAALALLFLPYAARVQARSGQSSMGPLSTRLTLVAVSIAGAYWAVILIFQHPLFHFLYSGRYSEVAHLVPAVAVGSVFWSACFGPAIALRAMESPASVFVAFALATFLSLLIGIPASWAFGVSGAVWGTNLADALSWVIVFIVLRGKLTGRLERLEQFVPWKRHGAQTLSE